MSRPRKFRKVLSNPKVSYFKPAGIKKKFLEEILLNLDEFEAINLIDLKDISQENAAEKMKISQSTLSRILKSARSKISDSIINGKAIKIPQENQKI
mgnify:CR=1 FL=1